MSNLATTNGTQAGTTADRIRSAAQNLFLSRNYADVTLDQIADSARLTKGAIYHHFSSKEDLYLAMMSADFEEKQKLFTAAIDEGRSGRDRLRRLTLAFFQLPRSKRELIRLVRRDAPSLREPVRARLVRAYQKTLPHPITQVLQEGIRKKEVACPDPQLAAWHFVAMVEVLLSRYADRVFKTTEQKVEYVLDLFFCGAGPARKATS